MAASTRRGASHTSVTSSGPAGSASSVAGSGSRSLSRADSLGSTPVGSSGHFHHRLGVLGAAIAVAIGGLVTELMAAVVSRAAWRPDGLTVPWGLALAVAGSVAIVVLARAVSRGHGFVAAGGWVVGLAYLLAPRPQFVIAGDALGWGFIGLATGAVVVVAMWGPGTTRSH